MRVLARRRDSNSGHLIAHTFYDVLEFLSHLLDIRMIKIMIGYNYVEFI